MILSYDLEEPIKTIVIATGNKFSDVTFHLKFYQRKTLIIF